MFVNAFVALSKAVMIFVCDDKCGFWQFLQSSCKGLHHTDLAQIHKHTPADKGSEYLVNKLSPVNKEQHPFPVPSCSSCNFCDNAGLSATAPKDNARGFVTISPSLSYLFNKVILIRSKLHCLHPLSAFPVSSALSALRHTTYRAVCRNFWLCRQ